MVDVQSGKRWQFAIENGPVDISWVFSFRMVVQSIIIHGKITWSSYRDEPVVFIYKYNQIYVLSYVLLKYFWVKQYHCHVYIHNTHWIRRILMDESIIVIHVGKTMSETHLWLGMVNIAPMKKWWWLGDGKQGIVWKHMENMGNVLGLGKVWWHIYI